MGIKAQINFQLLIFIVMKTNSLGFIGGGRITKIFLQAFTSKKADFHSIVVYDTNADVLNTLKNQFPQIKNSFFSLQIRIRGFKKHLVAQWFSQIKNIQTEPSF